MGFATWLEVLGRPHYQLPPREQDLWMKDTDTHVAQFQPALLTQLLGSSNLPWIASPPPIFSAPLNLTFA